jgi:hypothetical protein
MSPDPAGAERNSSRSEYAHSRTPGAEGEPVDAVPESVRDAARRAFDARPKDVLIADLKFDSLLDGDRRAGADPTRRSLRFGDGDGGADLTVTEVGERVSVLVQVLPAQKCDLEIRCKGSAVTVSTNEAGNVEFEMPSGLLSLIIRPTRSPQIRPLQTAWVRV